MEGKEKASKLHYQSYPANLNQLKPPEINMKAKDVLNINFISDIL